MEHIRSNRRFIYLPWGFVSEEDCFRKKSFKKKYRAGMVAPDNKKSSGISKEYVLETPINDQ